MVGKFVVVVEWYCVGMLVYVYVGIVVEFVFVGEIVEVDDGFII